MSKLEELQQRSKELAIASESAWKRFRQESSRLDSIRDAWSALDTQLFEIGKEIEMEKVREEVRAQFKAEMQAQQALPVPTSPVTETQHV